MFLIEWGLQMNTQALQLTPFQPNRFRDALQRGTIVVDRKERLHHIESWVKRTVIKIIPWAFGYQGSSPTVIARAFAKQLDALEKIPVRVNGGAQKANYQSYVEMAETILQSMKEGSKKVKKVRRHLKRRLLSLKYRLEGHVTVIKDGKTNNLGLQKSKKASEHLNTLIEQAAAWKKKQNRFPVKELTAGDLKRLQKAAYYTALMKLLVKDTHLKYCTDFFKWVLRDRNSVKAFIQFPKIRKRVSACALSSRVNAAGKKMLRIQVIDGEKHVTLPLVLSSGMKRLSILDEKKVIQYTAEEQMTIEQVYADFAGKKEEILGKLEVAYESEEHHGIYLWDPQNCSSGGKRIDFYQPEWWKQVPSFNWVNLEDAKQLYGSHLDGKNWSVIAKAASDSPALRFEGTHGYMDVLIPMRGGYAVYPFGKYAAELPGGTGRWLRKSKVLAFLASIVELFEKLFFLAKTVRGAIRCVDESVYHAARQHGGVVIPLSAEMGKTLMDLLRREILSGFRKNGDLVFQFQGENCSAFIQRLLDELFAKHKMGPLPDFYRVSIFDTNHPVLRPHFFDHFRNSSKKTQSRWLGLLTRVLGGGKVRKTETHDGQEKKWRSMDTEVVKEGLISLPTYLINQIKEGKLKGRVTVPEALPFHTLLLPEIQEQA